MSHDNAKTVQNIYAAFGRGDIPAILECLHPDVEWEYGQAKNDVPYLQPRRGARAVAGFFAAAAENLEFTRFVPKDCITSADGQIVVALVDVTATAKSTGKTIREDDEMHLWRFDTDGRVIRFRHGTDTAQHVAAMQG